MTPPSSPQRGPRPAVRIVEVGPRDGLQNIARTVPTSVKVELIQRLVGAGLATVEATSFVSPRWIPQLADNKEVLRGVAPLLRGGGGGDGDGDGAAAAVSLPVLVPNLRGLDDALAHGAREVAVFVSASEGFSRSNTNCGVGEALARARAVAARARQHGLAVRGYISCVVECPYDGPTPPSAVLRVAHALLDMGCYEVSLGDTLGTAGPADVSRLLAVLLRAVPAARLAGHFHDTHGRAVANVLRAHALGLRAFDASVAGLGGCPYAGGRAPGNVATEDVVAALERRGVPTGVDLRALAEAGRWVCAALGVPNRSRAGPAVLAAAEGGLGLSLSLSPPAVPNNPPPPPAAAAASSQVEEAAAAAIGMMTTATHASGRKLDRRSERASSPQGGRVAKPVPTRPRKLTM